MKQNPREELVDAAEAELRKNGWAYMEAPTGTGKTWMAFEVGSRFPGVKVYLAPTRQLVDQTRAEAEAQGLDSWFFATWQKVKNLTDLGLSGVALIIVDEIHVGGSGGGKSIQQSFENLKPKHVLYVSATTEPVNAKVFGSQAQSKAEITQEDAVAHGLILPIQMLAVTDKKTFALGAREQTIADQLSLTIDRLHEAGTVDLGEYAEEVRDIRARRRALLLSTALKRESSFVYFAENLEEADRTRDYLRERSVTSAAVSGASGKQANEDAIRLFAQGQVRVLIACRMLREGWNLPQLEAVVDAAFSPSLLHHTKQKAGRTARVFGEKKEGRYYYCLGEQERRRGKCLSRLELIREETDNMRSKAVIDAILLGGSRPELSVVDEDYSILSHVLGSGQKCDPELELHEQHASAVGAIALLRLAASGAPKPANRSSLGSLLKTIRTNPKHAVYKKLQTLRPEWLEVQEKSEDRAKKRWLGAIERFDQGTLSKEDMRYLRNICGRQTGWKHFRAFVTERKPELLDYIEASRGLQKKSTAEMYTIVKGKLAKNQKLEKLEQQALRGWKGKQTKNWKKLAELGLVKETAPSAPPCH